MIYLFLTFLCSPLVHLSETDYVISCPLPRSPLCSDWPTSRSFPWLCRLCKTAAVWFHFFSQNVNFWNKSAHVLAKIQSEICEGTMWTTHGTTLATKSTGWTAVCGHAQMIWCKFDGEEELTFFNRAHRAGLKPGFWLLASFGTLLDLFWKHTYLYSSICDLRIFFLCMWEISSHVFSLNLLDLSQSSTVTVFFQHVANIAPLHTKHLSYPLLISSQVFIFHSCVFKSNLLTASVIGTSNQTCFGLLSIWVQLCGGTWFYIHTNRHNY